MSKAHQIQKKTAQSKSEANKLATRKMINTINRMQTLPIQSSKHSLTYDESRSDSLLPLAKI
jgi:hypothetical protein